MDHTHHVGGSSSPWIRKPLHIVHEQEVSQETQADHSAAGEQQQQQHRHSRRVRRHLTLLDLLSVGVGGTVGSGIFVLTGQIASQYAGPLTFVSFTIAGLAACCSGTCYAELAARIPAAGSTYVYAYICWGEVVAVVSAACLTLEYGIAGAAVARR